MNDDDHLAHLQDLDWSVWRWICVRGAGFAASLPEALAASASSTAVDELFHAEEGELRAREHVLETIASAFQHLDRSTEAHQRLKRVRRQIAKGNAPSAEECAAIGIPAVEALRDATKLVEEKHAALEARFEDDLRRVADALRAIAKEPRFREAVTWQNRSAVENALDVLLRHGHDDVARWRARKHESLVANYLYRYATKNDTIGFFGPIAWGRVVDDEPAIAIRPGPTLLARRETYIEQWPVDSIARKAFGDARTWPWRAPHRFGFVRLEGRTAKSLLTGDHELTEAALSVLERCDGRTTTEEIALALSPLSLETVRAIVDDLEKKQLVGTTFERSTSAAPERVLRRDLERISDPDVRTSALAPLDALDAGRRAVAAAAGDADRLRDALRDLDRTFEETTNEKPTRHAGAMYASRGLVWEDCQRDLQVSVGMNILQAIGPALDLVLTSARFLTYQTAQAYGKAFRALYERLAKDGPVRFAELWFRAQHLFHGTNRPIDEVSRDVAERWARVLAVDLSARRKDFSSADLRSAVNAAFDAPRAGWITARHHSPDVMIAAEGLDAIRRGDWLAVLGEIHVAANTFDIQAAVAQHPSPDDLAVAMARDVAGPRFWHVSSKDESRMGPVRTSRGIFTPHDYEIEAGFFQSHLPRERVLPIAEMTVEDDGGGLVVVASELRFDLLDVVATTLRDVSANALELLPEADHSPRVTIDRLVVRRETWRFAPAALAFAFEDSDKDRFVGARRWARANGLPRRVYVRSSLEVKPLFLDFDSPTSVSIVCKIVRRAKEHVTGTATLRFSEMLPQLEQTWLIDADGVPYTSELRFVCVDRRR